jgi:hypothetical protein
MYFYFDRFFQPLQPNSTMKNHMLLAVLIPSGLQSFAQNMSGQNHLSKNYCSSFATNSSYEWIERVSVGREGNTSGNNNGYGDFTNINMHVRTGQAYFIHLMAGRLSNVYSENWTVYVDYNNDGDFDEANETVARGITKSVDSIKLCFVIPEHARICTTRMRVQMAYATSVTDPCALYEFGEVEDYGVSISCGSGIRSHTMAAEYDPVALHVFPNPVKGSSATVSMKLEKEGRVVFQVNDLSGKPLLMQAFAGLRGKNVFILTRVEKLKRGVFMLAAEQNGNLIGRSQLIIE